MTIDDGSIGNTKQHWLQALLGVNIASELPRTEMYNATRASWLWLYDTAAPSCLTSAKLMPRIPLFRSLRCSQDTYTIIKI